MLFFLVLFPGYLEDSVSFPMEGNSCSKLRLWQFRKGKFDALCKVCNFVLFLFVVNYILYQCILNNKKEKNHDTFSFPDVPPLPTTK